MDSDYACKPVIGLVGGIGSGKSLVAKQLASLGCAVIDADALAQQVLDQPAVRKQLVDWWGTQVLGEDGRVDRKAVGQVVFNQSDQLRRLEQLIHPQVHLARQALRRQYQADDQYAAIVEDCPLLIEKGLDSDCDVIIFIHCDRQTRLRRLAASRGWSEAELARREKNQLALDIKVQRADHILDNNAGEDECLWHVRRVFSQILPDQV